MNFDFTLKDNNSENFKNDEDSMSIPNKFISNTNVVVNLIKPAKIPSKVVILTSGKSSSKSPNSSHI